VGVMTATIDDFCADGFVVVRGAVAPDTVRACVDVIENELRARVVDPRDPKTWTQPVVRLPCPEGPPFATAGTSPALREMYDALLGPGCWIQREGVGGTVPIRFPSTKDPGDAGWHIDGSYDVDGQWWVNVHSRWRSRTFSGIGFNAPSSARTSIFERLRSMVVGTFNSR